MNIFKKIIDALISKKKVVGWIGAIGIAIGAVLAGMSSQEVRDAVCSASIPEVKLPQPPIEAGKVDESK